MSSQMHPLGYTHLPSPTKVQSPSCHPALWLPPPSWTSSAQSRQRWQAAQLQMTLLPTASLFPSQSILRSWSESMPLLSPATQGPVVYLLFWTVVSVVAFDETRHSWVRHRLPWVCQGKVQQSASKGTFSATLHSSASLVPCGFGLYYWVNSLERNVCCTHHDGLFPLCWFAQTSVLYRNCQTAFSTSFLAAQSSTGSVIRQGSQFSSQFWKAFCMLIGTKALLSSGFYSQTYGQTQQMKLLISWDNSLPWI